MKVQETRAKAYVDRSRELAAAVETIPQGELLKALRNLTREDRLLLLKYCSTMTQVLRTETLLE